MTGRLFSDNPNPYHRVDAVRFKGFVGKENLQVRETSGMACMFTTNSSVISVKTEYGDLEHGIYNAYPIFDWTINDVWTANGKMGWAYNSLYDLYYQAGVPLTRQRVASPFISAAIPMLHIYRAIDPDTWGKMISRVNGVNFAGMYGTSTAMGWRSIKCPKGFSWERYMEFLLSTLPTHIRHNYEEKLRVSKKFWRECGGCLAPVTKERELKKAIQEKYKILKNGKV